MTSIGSMFRVADTREEVLNGLVKRRQVEFALFYII